jgi:autotransporter passenger strand-loop-strand repeat protein
VNRGTSVATIVNSAGATLYDIGNDIGTSLDAGREFVESGGVADGTVVSGGIFSVLGGGFADGTVLDKGAVQVLQGGGVDNATVSGGTMLVQGATIGTTLESGREIVGAGGTADSTIISNGTLNIAPGAAVGGATPVTFTSGGDGTLRLDASSSFQAHFGPIAGFAGKDQFDLSDIAFGPNVGTTLEFTEANNNTSGTLTVSDGTHTANLLLLGQYVTAQFAISSDSHGGTLITDPPLAPSGPALHAPWLTA